MLGTLQQNQSEPYPWRLSREQIIDILNLHADEIVINAFPKNRTGLSLYRIRDAFGYCDGGWTPILLHLDCLAINSEEFNLDTFNIDVNKIDEHIFAILYMRGSIKEGHFHVA